jgi:ABC-type transport system involved in multi-copper enzyme maturation permease subunit
MFKILKAEFRRTFYHRSSLIFFGVTLLFCFLSISFQITAIFDSNTERAIKVFNEVFSFPSLVKSVVGMSFILWLFLAATITSHLIGADYQSNTWKMILPRTPQRNLLLTCKIINLVMYLAFAIFVLLVSVTIVGLFGAFWLNTSFFRFDSWQFQFEDQKAIVEIFAFLFWYVSVAALFTIISRSIIVGTFASFAFYILCVMVRAYSPEEFSMWFAPTHFGNLIPRPQSIVEIIDSSRPSLSVLASWIILSVHILGNLILSYFILSRQEFSGE